MTQGGAGSTEQAARAYPKETEDALNAWIAENERQGIWVSPAGWWYAGWKQGCADLEAARAENTELKETRDRLQRERDIFNDQAENLSQGHMQKIGELTQARARISDLEHEHADMHMTCSALPTVCPNEDRVSEVVKAGNALAAYIYATCQPGMMPSEVRAALTALDALPHAQQTRQA